MNDLAPGAVTTADLYRELVGMRADIVKALTRIEVIDTRATDADKLHADYESRLRVLERFRYTLFGASMVISAAVSGLGTWIGLAVSHH